MLRAVELHNFKCFRDQVIDLGALTLLSGLNGSGKSTVIQSLLVLRQSHDQNYLRSGGLVLNGNLVNMGTGIDVLFDGAHEDLIAINLAWKDAVRAEWSFSYDRESDVLNLVSQEPYDVDAVFSRSLFGERFEHLTAERVGPRTSFPISEYTVRQERRIGSRGELSSYYLSIFGEEPIPNELLAHSAAPSNALRAQVEAWLGDIAPGIRLHVTPHPNMDLVNLQYSDGQLSNKYRSTNVGFGLTYTLPVLLALLSAAPGALLLLENPEAHLHPRGQAMIGDLIARAAQGGVQIIVETHSDHVLNGIRVAVHQNRLDADDIRLHFFSRIVNEGAISTHVETPRVDRRGRVSNWPEGFFDEWDKNLEILLGPGVG